jgi:hypothetical protein
MVGVDVDLEPLDHGLDLRGRGRLPRIAWREHGEDCRGGEGAYRGPQIAVGERMDHGRGHVNHGSGVTGEEAGWGRNWWGACSRAGCKEERRALAAAGCREEDARGRGHVEALWTPSLCS